MGNAILIAQNHLSHHVVQDAAIAVISQLDFRVKTRQDFKRPTVVSLKKKKPTHDLSKKVDQ